MAVNILGIETSCDETAAAIVTDGRVLRCNVVASQIDLHRQYGGVVPEVAARSHLEVMTPVLEQALTEAEMDWGDIDAIAVTYGPGLSGSLLIGALTARVLAVVKNKPLYAVNHVEGHVYANWLLEKAPAFPVLALIVSGGHTQLALFEDHGRYQLLGQTRDDAVGEAFDKAAKIIGLPYPGGPSIAKAAAEGDPHAFSFPKAKLDNPLDFSFSGLKTAFLRTVQALCGKDYRFPSTGLAELLTPSQVNDLAASFQQTAIATLVEKTLKSHEKYKPATVVIAGGVAASGELRRQLTEALPVKLEYAPMELCTDNAAMIATLGYYLAQRGEQADPYKLATDPSLRMAAHAA